MKTYKLILNIVLWVVVIALAFFLYRSIQEPIKFNEEYDRRNAAVIESLKNIRTAQNVHLEVHGEYANSFDKLVNTLKHDSLTIINVIGNPDDTSVVTVYDTNRVAILDEIKFESEDFDPDKMSIIPFSDGKKYKIGAAIIEQNKVEIPVFEVVAPKEDYLQGLQAKFIAQKEDRKVGSLTEKNDSGNWE